MGRSRKPVRWRASDLAVPVRMRTGAGLKSAARQRLVRLQVRYRPLLVEEPGPRPRHRPIFVGGGGRRRLSFDEAGSITLFLAFSCLAIVVVVSAMARSGTSLILRARADAAADAAALGALAGMDPEDVAKANGAALVEVREGSAGERIVWVSVGGVQSVAAAALRYPGNESNGKGPVPTTGGSGGKREGLAPETLAALERADALLASRGLPSPIPVVSGLRSRAEQQALWARRFVNPYPVAPPGTSAHERGLAVDVPLGWVPYVLSVAAEAGLCQPFPESDPIHFGPVESPECGGTAAGRGPGRAVLVYPGELG